MKSKKYEFVERISNFYVGNDCTQIIIPHSLNSTMTLLNGDGITYHYNKNSNICINNYLYDTRKDQFPYLRRSIHQSKFKSKKVEYIDQLFDFNKVYIEIGNGIVKERYFIKDEYEALSAIKYIIPANEGFMYMDRDSILNMLEKANGGIYSLDGGYFENYTIPTEEEIIELYNSNSKQDINICNNVFIVSTKNNEIDCVKLINIKFICSNKYKVESYDFPITKYNLEDLLEIEKESWGKDPKNKYFRILNKAIIKEKTNKSKQLVLQKNIKK